MKELIEELKMKGLTLQQIADETGLKLHQVKHLCYYDGYKNKFFKDLDFDLLLSLWRDGMSCQQISNKLNIPLHRVQYQFRKRGL
jgi:DNA-binding CsgD family transcriptional regulator